MAEKLTATDYAGWTTARHVADKFYSLTGFAVLVNSFADKLRVGLAQAAAGYVSVNLSQADRGPVRIPREHWKEIKALAHDDLWQTGHVTIWVRERERSEKIRYDYHDVRFEPSSLGEMLATLAPASAAPPAYLGGVTHLDKDYLAVETEQAKDSTPAEPSEKGAEPDERPTVSITDLSVWFAAFTKIYPNWTIEAAIKSANGMFVGHRVPRGMVREQVGPRPRGRPIKPK